MDQELLNRIEYVGIFLGIMLGTIVLGTIVNRIFVRLIRRSTSELKNDPTNYKFLRRVVVSIIYIVGFSVAVYNLPSMRALANSLLAGAGILAVAAGFASQHALGNIISGLFIIIFRPFRVNDRLKVRELSGVVEDITLRHTVIRDFENRRIIIPNSIISEEIIVNADFSDEKICKWVDIGISYDSDIALARKIIKEEVLKHPLNIDPRTPEQLEKGTELVPVRVLSLGEFSVNLRAWAWANNSADAFNMGCDLLESIKNRFDKEGIEIPFPYRTLVYKEKKSVPEEPSPSAKSDQDRLEIF